MNIDFAIGLHIVGYLASTEDRLVSSTILAKSFGTSPVVLRRVLVRLNNSQLVETKRGASGGSKLARPPSEINLREVYESACQKVEVFARHPEGAEPISNILGGYINEFYASAENSMLNHLASISVADMDATVRPQIMAAVRCGE
ncbi:Rrf2 family transcriptional regulator [Enterovibrio calviensis]|uniref:Rrf2 family transcriptional regulator n=1 Tax=Enterovibrio calviensis TaxID=91359 RepID=UPI00138E26E1|nr:Rrf2 family transcriptional regulator [Enterovibrio calviensis]